MKKRPFKTVLLLVVVLTLMFSCTSYKSVVVSVDPQLKTIPSAVIVSANFNERDLPVLPLVDAGMYKSAVNKVAEELMQIEMDSEIEITKLIAYGFGEKLGINIPVVKENATVYDYQELDTEWAASIAAENNVDAVIVPMVRVVTTGVSAFGMKGGSYLTLTIYVISKDGSVIADGYYNSSTVTAKPKDTESYSSLISNHNSLTPELIGKLLN